MVHVFFEDSALIGSREERFIVEMNMFLSSSLCHFIFLFLDTSELSIIEVARLAVVQSAHLGRWRIRS